MKSEFHVGETLVAGGGGYYWGAGEGGATAVSVYRACVRACRSVVAFKCATWRPLTLLPRQV